MRVLGIVGSPQAGGRTLTATRAMLRVATAGDCDVDELELADDPDTEQTLKRMEDADAFIFSAPVYRARAAFPLKDLLDTVPRGMWGETMAPLQGKACALILTGATLHHFLAVDDLRSVLSTFFSVQVLSPGLYLSSDAFVDHDTLDEENTKLVEKHGRALVSFAAMIRESEELTSLRPLA